MSNRLANESSPYLRQHMHNPVDWWAWGPEAFAEAHRTNRPIFLSVGYSTCYWCHVMERECFENAQIAELMNRVCINIKVDREERPDVDQLYMTALQLLTNSGGWPMSVFLSPDLKPFYAGTYFPASDIQSRPGFPRVLLAIQDAWGTRKDQLDSTADDVIDALKKINAAPTAGPLPDIEQIGDLALAAAADFDTTFGGFGSAPKFPRETLLSALLAVCDSHEHQLIDARKVLAPRLTQTLFAMAAGGIRDHLGGGFHRYSTDARWLVPHFEIMLYDQAMLADVYVRAAAILDEPYFADVARGILDFVLRELTAPSGAFYTGLDAEVNAREGQNYLWTPAQIVEVVGTQVAQMFCDAYGLSDGPNFADPHHSDGVPDSNVLFRNGPVSIERDETLTAARVALRIARSLRDQPSLDNKIITEWNAMMIHALVVAARSLPDAQHYFIAAKKAMQYLLQTHFSDGQLLRSSVDLAARHPATLDDHAAVLRALDSLLSHTDDDAMREARDRVHASILQDFGDGSGSLFLTSAAQSDLLVRQRIARDSPLPSGNATFALTNLDSKAGINAESIVRAFSAQLQRGPDSLCTLFEAAVHLASRETNKAVMQQDPHVRITARRDGDSVVAVNFSLTRQSHLHPRPTASGARPLIVAFASPGVELLQAVLPVPSTINSEQAFFGDFTIRLISAKALPESPIKITAAYQACDDTTCFEPQSVVLTID